MHECGHGTLFANRTANRIVGQTLCAYPIMTDMHRYAAGHIKHHRYAGTEKDPDQTEFPEGYLAVLRSITAPA